MVNFIINSVVKITLNAILVVILIGACMLLAGTVVSAAALEALLNPAVVGPELLKQLPFVGRLVDYIFNLTSVRMSVHYAGNTSILSQVTFGMLVLAVSEIVMPMYHSLRRRANLIALPIAPLRLLSDVICFVLTCCAVIVSSFMLNAFVETILFSIGYGGWATMLGVSLLLAAVLAIKISHKGALKLIVDFVFGAFSSLLVCFTSVLLSCFQNLNYATAPESVLIITLTVIVLLTWTCIGACLMADMVRK